MQKPEPLRSKIFGDGKVCIPETIRRQFRLRDGDYLIWIPSDWNEIRVKVAEIAEKKHGS